LTYFAKVFAWQGLAPSLRVTLGFFQESKALTVATPASNSDDPDSAAAQLALKLAQLREEIDAVDVALHDLLLRRAGIVAKIRQVKSGGPALRPGREAQILRRLAKRHAPYAHEGIGLANILRIWREMIDSLTMFQSSFSVGVVSSNDMTQAYSLRDVVRDHYGSYTPLSLYAGPDQALSAVQDGTVTLAILPCPTAKESWWATLASRPNPLRVVACLPFFVAKNQPATTQNIGFVVAAFPAEPSGLDRSLVTINSSLLSQSDDEFASRLAEAWPEAVVIATDKKSNRLLVDAPGFIETVQSIPEKVLKILGSSLAGAHILGSYAVPLYLDPQGSS